MNILNKDLTKSYVKIALLNLLLVASLGLLMRYKIIFELPQISQKYAQHSHSHFAFIGWISHALFFLVHNLIGEKKKKMFGETQEGNTSYKFFSRAWYNSAIILNLLVAYALMISFLLSGYSVLSIILSTLSLFVSYFYAYLAYKDLLVIHRYDITNKADRTSKHGNYALRFSLIFLVVSSIGTYSLAYLYSHKIVNDQLYLSSIYFYLHFQYNGWFLFGLLGLMFYFLVDKLELGLGESKSVFGLKSRPVVLLLISVFPNFLLSILWAKLPTWVYVGAILFGVAQTMVWFYILIRIFKVRNVLKQKVSRFYYNVMSLVMISSFIKFSLQSLVLIPYLGKAAYAFRPIIIAYLHLVLLCVISLGILAYLYEAKLIPNTKLMRISFYHFIAGIFLNEIILGVQGFASMNYVFIPYINDVIFVNTILMFCGSLLLFLASFKKEKLKLT